MAVEMWIMVFWVVFNTEDGGDLLLQNIGNHLQDHTVSHPRRQHLTKRCCFYIFGQMRLSQQDKTNWQFEIKSIAIVCDCTVLIKYSVF
jgi:hypothetical protein